MTDPPLQYAFLDMNSYFASVEQQFCPACRGRPVGVIPVDSDRTCCIAVSTEAKRFGVKTGTAVEEARRLCPGIVLIKARPAFYVQVHRRLIDAIERHAPIEKVYSIDEVAIRLLGRQRQPNEALAVAQGMKRQIAADVGRYLTCSVGLAPSRLLAKIACELHKPDGLTVLTTDQLPQRLAHLKLTDLPGINTGMAERLARQDIHDIPALYALDKPALRHIWGSVTGEHYWYGLHGLDMPEPATRRHSIGHGHVLAPELRTDAGAHAMITRLLHKAGHRLRHHGYFAHRLTASVSFLNDTAWHDAIELPACQDTLTLLEHFQRLWGRRPPRCRPPAAAPPIKVQVNLPHLTRADATPGLLFPEAAHRAALARAIDRVNQRHGPHRLYFAGMHSLRQPMDDKIAFGRVPDETLPI